MPRKVVRLPVYVIGPSIAYIPLTQGKFTLVDEGDAGWLSHWPWFARWNGSTKSFYAVRNIRTDRGQRPLAMHTAIAGVLGKQIDHINPHHTLDNRRSNLRVATKAENCQNRRTRSDNKTGFKGVSFDPVLRKFKAQIMVSGRRIYLGWFETPERAHKAYVIAASEHHGAFARYS